jgi:hypothetical protein
VRTVLGDPGEGMPPNHEAQLAWLVILASLVLLVVITAMGTRRWRAQGLDVDGALPPAGER